MPKREYATDTYLTFAHFDHKTAEGRKVIEDSYNRWLWSMEESKWARGLQWFENASYLAGNHLTRYYYTADGGFGFQSFGIDRSSQFDNLVAKVADNRLPRAVEAVQAMLTSNQPMPRVTPNTDLPADEDAAKIAAILVKLLFEKPLELPSKLRDIAMWISICGTCAVETVYGDTDIPIEIPRIQTTEVPSEIFEGVTETREKIVGKDITWRQDIRSDLWTAFHLTPDPGATSPDDMSWIMRSSFEDRDVIRDKFDRDEEGFFPEALERVQTDNASKYILYWYSKIRDIIDSPQYYQHGGGLAPVTFYSHGGYAPNQTMLTAMDVKPSAQYPKGRYFIFAGGRLVYAGDGRCYVDDPQRPGAPRYPHRWHPYSFFHWFKEPGKWWGIPMLSFLVPLQKKINSIDVLVQANRQYMTIGQWLIPKHSKMREGGTSGITGEQYQYTDVGRRIPEKVRHEPLPQELLIERSDLIEGIDVISQAGSINAEISASAARSGPVLDFLRREKMRNKAPMLQAFQTSLENVAQNILIEIQTHMTEADPELIRRVQVAAREHSQLILDEFSASSIRDHHSVKIDVASELMHTPEAMEQKAIEVAQYLGQGMSPQEKRAVFKALKFDEFIENEENASVERARRMVARITGGNIEAAFPMVGIDKAAVMAPIFQDEILSERFLTYDQGIQQALITMFDLYTQEAAKEMERMWQMQMAMGTTQQGGQQ